MKYLFLILICILLPGCMGLTWKERRIFQKEVPEVPRLQAQHVEAVRQSAEYLAVNVEEQPEQQVAQALSAAVGLPADSIDEPELVVEKLRKGVAQDRKAQQKFETEVAKYTGKKIEGTGLDIAPALRWGFLAVVIYALVATGIGGPVFLTLLKRGRRAVRSMRQEMDTLEHEDPQVYAKLKDRLEKRLDRKEKIYIQSLKDE